VTLVTLPRNPSRGEKLGEIFHFPLALDETRRGEAVRCRRAESMDLALSLPSAAIAALQQRAEPMRMAEHQYRGPALSSSRGHCQMSRVFFPRSLH